MQNGLAEGLMFENRVFGHHSGGKNSVFQFVGGIHNFDIDVSSFIKKRSSGLPDYPNTKIGKSIFGLVRSGLLRLGIDTNNLFFADCIDTKLDILYFIDGIIYLPSVPNFPVTIDSYHVENNDLASLREVWIKSFMGAVYSETNFQNDLFAYKSGANNFINRMKNSRIEEIPDLPVCTPDFRKYATKGRPENHFVLTPYHTDNPRRRKAFAEMVARYLATVSKNGSVEP